LKIGLDAMGGDHAPQVIIDGVIRFLEEKSEIPDFFLIGKPEEIKPLLNKSLKNRHNIHIVPATEVIEPHESPVQALRSKKDSSLVRLIDLLKTKEIDVAISAGNTGALVACSLIKLRCLPGIDRPSLATILPSLRGKTVLLDCGANVDCSSKLLAQFAMMGSVYAQDLVGISSPRVALLNIVQGSTLGSKEVLDANQMLIHSNLNYIGLVQAFEMFGDEIDVLVTDGFIGNVALKAAESTITAYSGLFKTHVSEKFIRRIGGLLIRPAFRSLRKKMDYSETGGAPLLGVNGLVIKCHGESNSKSISNAIGVAIQSIENQLNTHITSGMEQMLVQSEG